MTVLDARTGVSRQVVLGLLLGLAPALTDIAAPVSAATRERVLNWARRQPTGPLALSDAPFSPDAVPDLSEQLARLDHLLAGWTRDDAWILGCDDAAYPKRLRRRLGADAPSLLFGRGDPGLAGRGGVAVVLGSAADPQRSSVLDAALEESMLARITASGATERDAGHSRTMRAGPASHGEIHIIRVAAPAARTTLRLLPPGQAGLVHRDALDACCYGLADTVVAVGVTQNDPQWRGLVALIAQDRQPVWVHGAGGDAGLLVRAGAHAITPDLLDGGADGLLLPGRSAGPARGRRRAGPASAADKAQPVPPPVSHPQPVLVHGFAEAQAGFEAAMTPPPARTGAPPMLRLVDTTKRSSASAPPSAPPSVPTPAPAPRDDQMTLFALFTRRLQVLLTHGPLGAVRIAEAMDLTRPQVDAWLLRAEAEGVVRSESRTRLFTLS